MTSHTLQTPIGQSPAPTSSDQRSAGPTIRYSWPRTQPNPLGIVEPVFTEDAANTLTALPERARTKLESTIENWSTLLALRLHRFPQKDRLLWLWRIVAGIPVERTRKVGDYGVVHLEQAQHAYITHIEPWTWWRPLVGTVLVSVARRLVLVLGAVVAIGGAIKLGIPAPKAIGAAALSSLFLMHVQAAIVAFRWARSRKQENVAELEARWQELGLGNRQSLRLEEYCQHTAFADAFPGASGAVVGPMAITAFLISAWVGLHDGELLKFSVEFLVLLMCWLVTTLALGWPILVPHALPRGFRITGALVALAIVLPAWGFTGSVLASSDSTPHVRLLGAWLQWSAVLLPTVAVIPSLLKKLFMVISESVFPAEAICCELIQAGAISLLPGTLSLHERRKQRVHLEAASRIVETSLPRSLGLTRSEGDGMRRIASEIRRRMLWVAYPQQQTDKDLSDWVKHAIGHVAAGQYHYLQMEALGDVPIVRRAWGRHIVLAAVGLVVSGVAACWLGLPVEQLGRALLQFGGVLAGATTCATAAIALITILRHHNRRKLEPGAK